MNNNDVDDDDGNSVVADEDEGNKDDDDSGDDDCDDDDVGTTKREMCSRPQFGSINGLPILPQSTTTPLKHSPGDPLTQKGLKIYVLAHRVYFPGSSKSLQPNHQSVSRGKGVILFPSFRCTRVRGSEGVYTKWTKRYYCSGV